MKIKIKERFGSKEENIDFTKYIEQLLDGDEYERGALESARATADKTGSLLAKLIEVLISKNLLQNSDLLKLFKNDLDEIAVDYTTVNK